MSAPPLPLCALPWTADLVPTLVDASAAIARLDARVSASSVAPAWRLRASWQGYAAALRLEQHPVEEIDIIAQQCGLHLAGRERISTVGAPLADYPAWLAQVAEKDGRHWREELPFSFDPPAGWDEAPALLRALSLLDEWCRREPGTAPWLAGPMLLRRFGVSETPLPCLVAGDPGQRFAIGPRPALLKRLLKQLGRSAEDGLVRLERLEEFRVRAAAAVANEHRAGKLAELVHACLSRPSLAARSLAPLLEVTISGAGKLLERGVRLGLLVEISGRGSWRSYVASDVAIALGLRSPERGRPRALPRPTREVSAILGSFDAEMAMIDARLERLGMASTPGDIDHDIDL